MTKLHLDRRGAEASAEQLVAEADAEQRGFGASGTSRIAAMA
jgi:hypothetical protein